MKKRTVILVVGAFFALVSSRAAFATPVTLTFDELFQQPADGLSFMGVTFGFTVNGAPSSDALYGTDGPGGSLSDGFVLNGDGAGILSLTFASPTPTLQFAVVLNEIGTLTPGFTVQLFDPASLLLGTFPVTTDSAPFFTGSIFTSPGGLVGRVVIDFNEAALPQGAPRFALDNLSYELPQAVPEPATRILVGIGTLAVAARRAYRRPRRRTQPGISACVTRSV